MAQDRKLNISLKPTVMHINRLAIADECLIYVICANKAMSYSLGKSHIAYIGTTRKGIGRIASSSADKAADILGKHGVKSIDIRVVTTTMREGIESWKTLERAMLIVFREKFGSIPYWNTQGKNLVEKDEFEFFEKKRVFRIVTDLSNSM